MDKLKTIISFMLVALIYTIFAIPAAAQSPEQFKYQAVLRSADGTIMDNEAVSVDISILKSDMATSVFDETHNTTTTAQGIINLNIGSVSDLTVVDWAADEYFIEITVNGTLMGTSQLLSVPYALHSKTADNFTGEITESQISDLQAYLTSENDPEFSATFNIIDPSPGDLLIYNGESQKWEQFTPNYADSLHGHELVNETDSGFMSAEDKMKLDGTEAGAQANVNADWSAVSGDALILNKPVSISEFTLDAGSQAISNLADPVNAQDAATKAYVDLLKQQVQELENLLVDQDLMVRDYEGTLYKTVTIGQQVWMAENLRVTHYADGTPISHVSDNTDWSNMATGSEAFCYYNNDTGNQDMYGNLYTHAAAANACPNGWHLPTTAEWDALISYLQSEGHSGNEAEVLKSETGWNGSDLYGFNALPGGFRYNTGAFDYLGTQALWWAQDNTVSEGDFFTVDDVGDYYSGFSNAKNFAYSVRCIKD